MRKAIAAAVLVVSAVFIYCSQANAGWYHWAIRGYGLGYYSPCFVPGCNSNPGCWVCNPYAAGYGGAHRHCHLFHHHGAHRYAAAQRYAAAGCGGWRSYFDCGGCGWDSCGWNSCGSGSCGSGGCGWSSCGGDCGGCLSWAGGCGGGGCMGGGCDGGASSGSAGGENVIYDGPADGAPSAAPPPMADDQAGMRHGVPYRLVSATKRDGSAAFDKGLTSLRNHSLNDALASFDSALSAEPKNPMYCYHRALVLYELSGADAANDTLQRAVELEKDEPIANWGKRMERVQGRSRVWIESARRSAGIGR